MKLKVLFLSLILVMTLVVGCAGDNEPTEPEQEETPNQTTPPETEPDVVTTASIVNTPEDFKAAISDEGTWIIAVTEDITFEEDIALEGEYKNGKKDDEGKDIIQRKVALYAQDENRNVTDRYTLTAPKLTINSPNARIQSGTFKGDIYVSANNFELVDATVDGNIYFTTEEAQSTFTMDDTSEVTGEQSLQE